MYGFIISNWYYAWFQHHPIIWSHYSMDVSLFIKEDMSGIVKVAALCAPRHFSPPPCLPGCLFPYWTLQTESMQMTPHWLHFTVLSAYTLCNEHLPRTPSAYLYNLLCFVEGKLRLTPNYAAKLYKFVQRGRLCYFCILLNVLISRRL